MRPNLITRLKEEWNNLDPVDPLRGLIADAIDALAEQPAQQDMPKIGCVNHDCDQCKAQQQQEHVSLMTVLHLKDRTEIGYGPASAGYDLPTGEYKLYTSPPASKPLPEDYTALEQALTRLQKRYADLEGRASKPLTDDPLQGAVDWLLEADGEYFCTATVQRTLRIGYNRAKRLCDTAKERAAHGIKGDA